MKEVISPEIQNLIYVIRGQKVMMDSDLAELYGVETKRLLEQVKRNQERFPVDFLFVCNSSELGELRSQFAAANPKKTWSHKRRNLPCLFTESGIAMLSSVLNSDRAIQVNISIIRIFVKLRSFLAMESSSSERIEGR